MAATWKEKKVAQKNKEFNLIKKWTINNKETAEDCENNKNAVATQ